jgi:tetratricopeptide (TPR) repeat protein
MSKNVWEDIVEHFQRMLEKGNFQAMQETLKIMEETAIEDEDDLKRIITHFYYGAFYAKQNFHRKAEYSLEKGISLADVYITKFETFLEQLILGLKQLGELKMSVREIELGYQYLERSLSIAEKYNMLPERNLILHCLASYRFKFREYNTAKLLYERMLQIGKDENQTAMEMKAASGLGKLAYLRGDTKQALEYYDLTEQLLEQQEDLEEKLALQGNRVALLSQTFNYEEAIEKYKAMLETLQALQNDRLQIIAYTNMANMSIYLDRMDQAAIYMDQALTLTEETDDHSQFEQIQQVQAFFYFEQGKYSEAARALEEALKQNERSHIHYNRILILLNRAHVYAFLDEWDKAECDFNEATTLGYTKENSILKIRGMVGKGCMMIRRNRTNDGLSLINHTLDIEGAPTLDIPKAMSAELAALTCASMDVNKEAIRYYKQAIDWYKKIRFLPSQQRCEQAIKQL